MKYKTKQNDTLYSVALKFFPNNVIQGIFRINDVNSLYGNDLFLLEKLMDCPLGEVELTI